MPSQLEFDYRFSRCIKQCLKRQCSTSYLHFASTSSYYPYTFVSANYSDLPKLHPPKENYLTDHQVHEMRNWRTIHGQSVPPKKVRNMSNKDKPETPPINLYAISPPNVQPLDLTKLGDHSLQHLEVEATDLLYRSNQIVFVKGDKGDSENSLALAYLQENVKVNRRKVMAKVFVQDTFNPTWFLEDFGKYVEVKRIMCILSSYRDNRDVLELKEQDLTLLQDEIQGTNDALTLTEAAETVNDEPEQPRHLSRSSRK